MQSSPLGAYMQTRKILIVTKTYPSISKKYRETVCTAGILLDEAESPLQWIRIYPVRYRDLDFEKKYPKWGIISASIERNSKDYREESYRIDDSSIVVERKLGTSNGWEERRKYFEPLAFKYIDDIKAQGKSLGVIKPTKFEYSCEEAARNWPDSQQVILDQGDLLKPDQPFSELEKIPYKFFYKFTDGDKTHKCSIIDWEISQLYRKMRDDSVEKSTHGKEGEALEKVRIKLAEQFKSKDLYFLMGNLKNHKNSFVIIGLIYPPLIEVQQLNLL